MHWGNHSNYDAFLSAMRSDGLGDLGSSKKVFASTVAAWESYKSLRPAVIKQAQAASVKVAQILALANTARAAVQQADADISGGRSAYDFFSFSASSVDTSGIDEAEAVASELQERLSAIVDEVSNGSLAHQTASTVNEQAQLDAAAGIHPDWAGWAGQLSQYQSDISGINSKLAQLTKAIQNTVSVAQRQAQAAVQKRQVEEQRARAAELAQQRAEEAAMRAEAQRQQRELQAEQKRIDAELRQEQAIRDAEMRREQQIMQAEQARANAELQREQQRMAMEAQLEAQRAALEQQKLNALYPPVTQPAYDPYAQYAQPTQAPVVSPFPDVQYADTRIIQQALPPPSQAAAPYVAPPQSGGDWFYDSMWGGSGNEMFGDKNDGLSGMGDMGTGGALQLQEDGAPTIQHESQAQQVINKLLSEGNVEAAKSIINAIRPGTIPVAPPPEPKKEVPWGAIALGVAGLAVVTKLAKVW